MTLDINLTLRDAPPIVWIFLLALILFLVGKLFDDSIFVGIGGFGMIVTVFIVIVGLIIEFFRN